MDAAAYLKSQGWRGSGHSLHHTSDAIGLSRPILVSQKQNTLGVGKKQHKTSDMWWMNAFDKSLKGLDTSKEGEVVQTVTSGALDMVAKGGGKWAGKQGLYSCFVKGETLVGSVEEFKRLAEGNKMIIAETEVTTTDGKKEKEAKKTMEAKEERRWRKLEKRAKRAAKEKKKAEGTTTPSSDEVGETKVERKERRRQKRDKKARKAAKALLLPKAPKKSKKDMTDEELQDIARIKSLKKDSKKK